MKKILIVEDDNDINAMLCDLLNANGYAVKSAYSGTEGISVFENGAFDLVLLDLMLPGKSGLEVIKQIRTKSETPVVMLTAVADKAKTVELLKSGANDYITKPFDNAELLARINVQLRSREGGAAAVLKYKGITLKPQDYKAELCGEDLGLSKTEFEILKILIISPKRVFTKNNLYESVWQGEYLGDENTVNVHISKIRAKLNKLDPDTEYIKTVWGIGFKMV